MTTFYVADKKTTTGTQIRFYMVRLCIFAYY